MTGRKQYDSLIEAYVRAHEVGDAEAIGPLFAEDGLLLEPGRLPIKGRRAIQHHYKEELVGGGLRLAIEVHDFHEGGDFTYGAGTFEVEEGTGNFLNVLQRRIDNSLLYQIMCCNWH